MASARTKRTESRPSRPCPVCDGTHGCSTGQDGLIMCRRKSGPVQGFAYLGQAKGDSAWALYRPADTNGISPPPHPHPHKSPKLTSSRAGKTGKQTVPWILQAQQHAAELTSERKIALSRHLGIPLDALDSIQHIGSRKDSREGLCWTFPEQSGDGEIVGLIRRRADGKKRAIQGSARGLSVQRNWEEMEGPVYVPEGASCVLALAAMGLAGVGRPSNTGGVADLARLFGTLPATRPIIVLGEWDARGDGRWPGLEGAKSVAEQLAAALKRPILWALPPDQAKDVRAFAHKHLHEPQDSHRWDLIGQQFRELLVLNTITPPAEEQEQEGLVTRTFSQIEPDVMEWIVPGYFPMGELILFSGDGGVGKSFVTVHLAARLTRGEPVFGLKYTPENKQAVLMMACEDSASQTQKPRLMAADADTDMVHLVEGVRTKAGKFAPFSLAHIDLIDTTLGRLKNCGLVFVDPVSAFLGGTGINPGRDDEIRTLLEPLRIVARTHQVSVVMVKHFNKSTSPVAKSRIADAAAWRNACRASYIVLPDPEVDGQKLFLLDKLNGAPDPFGLMYRIVRPDAERCQAISESLPASWSERKRHLFLSQLALTEWLGETDQTGNSVCMNEASQLTLPPGQLQEAAEWLKRYLANGPAVADDVAACGNATLGYSRSSKWWRDTILKGILQGKSKKESAYQGQWFFCLPGQDPPSSEEQ